MKKNEEAAVAARRGSSSEEPRITEPLPAWMDKTLSFLMTMAAVGLVLYLLSFTAFFWGIAKGVTGVFGSNAVSEYSAAEQFRKTKFTKIKDKGEEIDDDARKAEKKAIDAFIKGGESYRMKGKFQFGRVEGSTTYMFTTKVKMSYNAELDVYKLTLTTKADKGYQALEDKKLKPFHIPDGTYYIVKEDSKTWVLSDCNGVKKAEQGTKNLYKFLTMYCINGCVDTDFMGGRKAQTSYDYHVWDGSYYFRSYGGTKYNLYPGWIELKTHKDMPVKLDYRTDVPKSDVGYKITADFYYSGIPKDKPTVEGYVGSSD